MNRRKLKMIMAELERRRPKALTWTTVAVNGERRSREIPFDQHLHRGIVPGQEIVMDTRELFARLVNDDTRDMG